VRSLTAISVNLFSSTDVFLTNFTHTQLKAYESVKVDTKFVQIFVPKLVHGSGTYVELSLLLSNTTRFKSTTFEIDALSDQGSIIATDTNKRPILLQALIFYQNYQSDFNLMFVVIVIALITVYFAYRYDRKLLVRNVIQEIIRIRSKIVANTKTNENLTTHLLTRTHMNAHQLVKNVEDWIKMEDLLLKLFERNQNADSKKIEILNMECLEMIDKTLHVKWRL
jgi:hypothetical protein